MNLSSPGARGVDRPGSARASRLRVEESAYVAVAGLVGRGGPKPAMWFAWVVAIVIVVVGIVVLSHLGVDMISVLSNGFHQMERVLGTPL